MLPILTAIGTGLSVASSIKNLLTDKSSGAAAQAAAKNTTQTTATPTTSGASSTGAVASTEQQDRFLKLLVTQMKNQDPLNPLDNAQVTSQLAQINTVNGIEKLNNTVQALSTSMMSNQSLQTAAMIGRQVYAVGSTLNLADGKATGALNLPQDADRVYVSIANEAGAVLRRIDLGAAKAGMSGFQWDGKTDTGTAAPDGKYVFQLTAARGNVSIPIEPITLGKIDGVSLASGTNGMKLNLQGGGSIGMADVKQIF
jgi:flagellar basal-body rod modification protein FlgD